jgi:superfamily II DNA or RNA helicase
VPGQKRSILNSEELKSGVRVSGLVVGQTVKVIAVERTGEMFNVVYQDDGGRLEARLVSLSDLVGLRINDEVRWTFDGDGKGFRLASEARRIELAHLFDPFAAVQTATIQPLPHQIDAVYGRMLPMQPLHFLLADDPGAGKTIMSGLYIRELILRGDLDRCLIISPGSLVEQWQDELFDKFGLSFDILSRDMVEAARTGNPFAERNRLIVRLDQLSRNQELQVKLEATDWDLIIFDEAHKLSAHLYGDVVNETLRYKLAKLARDHTRNLLLLTATPHNGNNDDFNLFLALLDPDRFEGKLRNAKIPDISDIMRRLVKENLLTFDGKRLFPPREAVTIKYDLSPEEMQLYEAVTSYVQEGMNRAKELEAGPDKRRGLAVGFALAALQRRLASSPHAIMESLRRRREKLSKQLLEAQRLGKMADTPVTISVDDPDDFDSDDYDAEEFEKLEDEAIEGAVLASTIAELEREVTELRILEDLARTLRASGVDRKWNELRSILQSSEFNSGAEPRKIIIFTEHKDTLSYLVERITTLLGNDEMVAVIHGGVNRDTRRRVQEAFRNDPTTRILIATDAAGEGVNLQRANLMVNYDIPWNPNRIEQRFGRIHRIGQTQICYLWNLVANETREGRVFERLFEKIEEQRRVYGDQIYDCLGDAQINRALQELLIKAIQDETDPKAQAWVNEIIDAEIGARLQTVLNERALADNVLDESSIHGIKHQMELALARKLQPGFIESFVKASLDDVGGRMTAREARRFQISRVPAEVRSRHREILAGGHIQTEYERVTFDKSGVIVDGHALRADLVCPGHPLLSGLVSTIHDKYSDTLSSGVTLVDETDFSDRVRILVALEHSVSDGRIENGQRKVVSRRFQFVEVAQSGEITDPGPEPYLNYRPISEADASLISSFSTDWAKNGIDEVARNWATANLAGPHHTSVNQVVQAKVERVRAAVRERLDSEIRYWDLRAEELKAQELQGKKPRHSSGRARARADELEVRKAHRLRELDMESDLVNHAPIVVTAALIISQGMLNRLSGNNAAVIDPEVAKDTDRRAVAAVLAAERTLGRIPEEQDHNNPGFDVLSTDPETQTVYFIEVKGHRPDTTEIHVSASQIRKAKMNPERFRLAVVRVPNEDDGISFVRYFVKPFDGYEPHFAQTYVPLKVAELAPHGMDPQ